MSRLFQGQIPQRNYTMTESTESRGRVVTRWPGSQEVGGSIPAATKICKV